MDFSIITPSFNYGHFIRECLDSVASQTGVSFEHLVQDGGSTDGTLEVVREFPHVSLVTQPDKGMCDGINKGFDRCRGEWVMWLNSDDRLKPGALKAVADFAEKHPDADVIFGCWDFVDQDGEYIRTMTLFPYRPTMLHYLGCYVGSTATFFRRSTVIDSGERLSLEFRIVMDGEFYARLASKGFKFSYLPHVLADFRLHENNLSLRVYKAGSEVADVEACLRRQKQFAETRAIRRAYGWTLFKDENLNNLVDGVFYLFFRCLKPLMKIIYRPYLRRGTP